MRKRKLKRIYGIYENNKSETCVCVGNIEEVSNFLEIPKTFIRSAACRGNLIKTKYRVCSLYTEG